MKKFCLLCVAIMLSGCVGSSQNGVLNEQPRQLSSLIGQSRAKVHSNFGSPVITRFESNYAVWSYRTPDGAMLVYFDKEGVCRHAETRGCP